MIGGLGGFVLPIAFGALNDLTGLWSSCFMLLFAIVLVSLVWMDVTVRRMQGDGRPQTAPSQAFVAAE
jgi:NNP family nitrate/nitrite transporter-like MFS transporter